MKYIRDGWPILAAAIIKQAIKDSNHPKYQVECEYYFRSKEYSNDSDLVEISIQNLSKREELNDDVE